MNTQHLKNTYRPDIDGLRAIAVIAVILFHAFPELLPGGFTGVDIFFVISGFLITTIIAGDLENNNFSFKYFYGRRIRRIFPALLAVLIFCLIAGWFILLPNEYKQLGKHIAASSAFFANISLWWEVGYFDSSADLKPLLHLWSLGIEEQFYLFWPLILYAAWRLKINLLSSCLLIFIASFLINLWLMQFSNSAAFYLPVTRAWELSAGAIIALLKIQKYNSNGTLNKYSIKIFNGFASNKKLSSLTELSGILTIVLYFVFAGQPGYTVWSSSIPAAGAALIILSGTNGFIGRNILGNKLFVFIGLISYPLYLWHWPILAFLRIMEQSEPGIKLKIAGISISFLMAYLTYALIEKNIRFRKNRLIIPVLIMTTILNGITGYLIYKYNGIPQRMSEFNSILEEFQEARPEFKLRQDCNKHYSGMQSCLMTDLEPRDVVIIGDSHSRRLYYGLSVEYAKIGRGVLSLGKQGCPPLIGIESGDQAGKAQCIPVMEQAFMIASGAEVRTVFLASRGPVYLTGSGIGETPDAHWKTTLASSIYKTEDPAELFESGLNASVKSLSDAGKKVVLVIDNPELGFNPVKCMDISRPVRIMNGKALEPCAISRQDYDQRSATYKSIINRVANNYPDVQILDLSDVLCDENLCYAKLNGKFVYQDGDHLSVDGSKLVGKYFFSKFSEDR